MGLKHSSLLHDLDKTLAAVGGVLSLILIIYLGWEINRVIYLLIGVLVLTSCLLWMIIRKKHPFEFHLPESQIRIHLWVICFFTLYILSVFAVYFRPEFYERPLIYFVLTALMAGIIACEIFSSDRRHAPLILIQILLLGVSLAWSQLLIFPSLLGVDPWHHFAFTGQIVNESSIPEGYPYSKLPLFHLMIALAEHITGLPYKFAAMVSVSLGQIICNAIFVFLIAKSLFKSYQIGLIAALMVIIANHHIFMTYWSIPNALAAVFIPITLYLFLIFKGGTRSTSIILRTMALAPIILMHTITAICMAILLFVTWGAFTFYQHCYSKVENSISLYVPIIYTIMMLIWWTYSEIIGILTNIIKYGFSQDFYEVIPQEISSHAVTVSLGETLFNNFGMFLFFAFSFIGIFYMVSRKKSSSTFVMALVGMTPLAIGFISLISGFHLIEHRWWYFALILLSIPLAVAIYIIGTWETERSYSLYCFVFGFVVILSFFMIMSSPANIDNHTFSPVTGSTYAYTQSEMIASGFFALNAIGVLSSDFWYCSFPTSSVFVNVYGIGPERLQTLDYSLISGEFYHDGSIKIIRSKYSQEPLIRREHSLRVLPDLSNYLFNLGFNKIYDNPTTTGYFG